MPNWTSNHLTIEGDAKTISEIKDLLKNEEDVLDFNKIIPMPISLNIESGGIQRIAVKIAEMALAGTSETELSEELAENNMHLPYTLYSVYEGGPKELDSIQDVVELGNIYLKNDELYGAQTWYDWCCTNWGTKWNASAADLTEDEPEKLGYQFDTAWSEPTPVFETLSKKYPDVTVINAASYEDPEPYTIFTTVFKNGKVISEFQETDEDMKAEYQNDEEED